jgi:hypothetical protein
MASKLVLVLGICVVTLFMLSPVTAIEENHAVENKIEAAPAEPAPSKIRLISFLQNISSLIPTFFYFFFLLLFSREKKSDMGAFAFLFFLLLFSKEKKSDMGAFAEDPS